MAFGHDGVSSYDKDDNPLFLEIALLWLKGDRSQKILLSVGHRETPAENQDALTRLPNKLTQEWSYVDVQEAADLSGNAVGSNRRSYRRQCLEQFQPG